MRVGATWSLALVAVLGACHGREYDLDGYRSARQRRSALALAKYLHDGIGNHHDEEARKLLDKHFEYALAREKDAELGTRLLAQLRHNGDPRVVVHVREPSVAAELDDVATAYFAEDHGWDYDFASGASRGVAERFPHQVLVFAYASSYSFEPDDDTPRVEVDFSVEPSGVLFNGPVSLANISAPPPPIEGIQVQLTMRFYVAGQSDPIERSARGAPKEGFTYQSSMGFADTGDMYSGMVEASFEDAVRTIFE